MIYFDNAATTLVKPAGVARMMYGAMCVAGGYGRSGHKPAIYAGEMVYRCRERAAKLFGLTDPTAVVFTLNATHALNLAIYALSEPPVHAAVTGYEHNSVTRPLFARSVPYTVLKSEPFDDAAMLTEAEAAIQRGADLFIINHVSNVFGSIAPLKALDEMLAKRGIPMILDASQSAGVVDIDVGRLQSVAAVCMPGHKGLYGPQGTGMLLVVQPERFRRTLMQGGTGSASAELAQPAFLPDRFECGTPNVPGIAGLGEGIAFVLHKGTAQIAAHERRLLKKTVQLLSRMEEIETFHAKDLSRQSGVLSFRHQRISCEQIAQALAEQDVCVRAGLHCAPLAHQSAGSFASGTVRLSFSAFNTEKEVVQFAEILGNVVQNL